MKAIRVLIPLAVLILSAAGVVRAQEKLPPPPPSPADKAAPVPLKVQVVFSEFEGEKRISSMPFILHHTLDPRNPGEWSSLRIGAKVPIAGKEGQVQYMDVGTNIDFRAKSTAEGAFHVNLTVRRTSVYSPGQEAKPGEGKPVEGQVAGTPVLRNFDGQASLLMRDGQTAQAIVATDPGSGRVLKVDITLNVVR